MNIETEFEPRILGFCCNWCSYAGADLAGVSRMQYRPNIRIIRVMCSGRVDPQFVIEGFLQGMDGVMVLGCHLGDCHYMTGNYEAINMIGAVRRLIEHVGVNSRRLLLEWVSASEGQRFSEVVNGFVEVVRQLGPLGISEGQDIKDLDRRLRAAKMVAQGEKLRWVAGKQTEFETDGNRYGEVFTRHELNRMLDGVIIDELAMAEVLLTLSAQSASVKEISAVTGLEPPRVLRYISALRRKRLAQLHSIEASTPRYNVPAGEETRL